MTYEYKVHIQYDLVKGLLPVFTHADGPNPFEIGEWPDIRTQLREDVLEDVPQEYETYLNSDRVGERFEYTIGTIKINEDTGELVEKKYDASIEALQNAFEDMGE